MYFDLSGYIEYLEAKNELIRIHEFVNPELEIAEVVERISKIRTKGKEGGKALLFLNTGTDFPVLINAFGSDNRVKAALGLSDINDIPAEIDLLFKRISSPKANLWDKLKLLPTLRHISYWFPKVVKMQSPSCQEVVMPSPKLSNLPILKCWPHDGGRFITLPLVHTKDLETGLRNVGMYRLQIFDDATTGMHWHRHKTGAKHFESYKKAKKLMPVAVTLGGDPAYTWCAAAPLPENVDEYLFAGFLRKYPVRLVKCLTQDIEIPEDSDFVIEGYIDPSEAFAAEGPFGDHTGFYSLTEIYPKMHVTCITHRKGAVYPATVVGIPPQEDTYISKAIETIFLKPIQMLIAPEITDLYLPKEGVCHNIAIIAIEKTYPGQAIKIANAMWGAGQMMFCKVIIVVDSNVDTHSASGVMSAMGKHWHPSMDTYFTKGPLDVLDHAARQPGFGGKLCIDATKKMPEEESLFALQTVDKTYIFCNEDNIPATKAKLTVIFDRETDLSDFETCLWIATSNIDAAYDCTVENNSLTVDARTKFKTKDFHRPWPNVICMDDATINAIDEKWEKLGLGKFIQSPSLKYKHLVKSNGAQMN
ncbi:MAG: menaquinone biosynthesis decarboxylase [Prevotellaceae bacterium]|jgi:4-hydroxy-3-polyprenylbenzoate decarboxylase|nr:menaquinone biosynthesis decarboxylase [Prevotellaceae bacterium]